MFDSQYKTFARCWGAMNEIKTLASSPNLSEYKSKVVTSEKIYVEEGSNLISFANAFELFVVDLVKRRSQWTAGIDTGRSEFIEVTHGKSHRNRMTSKSE